MTLLAVLVAGGGDGAAGVSMCPANTEPAMVRLRMSAALNRHKIFMLDISWIDEIFINLALGPLWLNGECSFFGDALGLLEVSRFMDHDDAIGVHHAVGDRGRDR